MRYNWIYLLLLFFGLDANSQSPVVFTAQQDKEDMMRQLGIKVLRNGASGDDKSPNRANNDEALANPYPNYPDALLFKNNTPVRTALQWQKRRGEIVEDFEREVYGRVPKNVPGIKWKVKTTEQELVGLNPVVSKQLVGEADNSAYPLLTVNIAMKLVLPVNAKGPVPVLIMFGRVSAGVSPTMEQLITAGWGYALLDPNTIQADNGAGLTKGIIGLTNKGQVRKPEDWGALRAWAWGASQALAYLYTEPMVNRKQIGIEGVSRFGKAALVTMAFDQRFAMGLIASSGQGGTKPNRRNFGEAVENLAGGSHHWMAGNYLKYAAEESTFGRRTANDIPVESNQLIALCAPRLTFISHGIPAMGDANWLDHQGSYMATVAAGAVFKLLGAKDLGVSNNYKTEKMPGVNVGLLAGQLAWRQYDGGHTDAPNIKYFIQWAKQFLAPPTKYRFEDHRLDFNTRVNDLVSRMTLEEKVSQMLNSSPAISRLNIPAYDWWNEVLHGVARTPFNVTVYPQAIAMAATFDKNSLFKMADYSALEGRAVHNKALALGRGGERYVGLTYWTPNINIFRDPRWGRGQETYGEDPFLTSAMGSSFVRGLQGDDPKYLKAAACAKHYAVHSGPEPARHVFNAEVSRYDLWDTYLPAFKKLVVDAKVEGVMCAYNAFQTQPCCGSDLLMVDILRKQWNFTGYVTSDCWGIDDFFKNHKTHADATAASADAVIHGTDVECGTDAYKSLVKAVKEGKLSESQIDVSVKRLFLTRFKLGMFDPPELVRYAQTPASVLESAAHQAHALKMARQSIVMLKNQNHTLPLSKSVKKIVVLGPNADNPIAILGNYNGTPSKLKTVLQGIKEKIPNANVVYEQAINFTNDTLLVYSDYASYCRINGKQGFKAEYFDNVELKGNAVNRHETELRHAWQEGQEVVGSLKARNFSARYTTTYTASEAGSITFEVQGDDGYRFKVDGVEVLNAWTRNRWGSQQYKLITTPGKSYELTLEYWQGDGKANISLSAGNYKKTDFTALTERIKDADAIVFVGGISPQLEGEEMKVNFPGFHGGDRTSILLPTVQTSLMKAVSTLGKPMVFVMMTGSAIAIPWEAENVPAIINSWYGGQAAGTAIADVLFGDYNPAGRLPVTFYGSDTDLPDFSDYSMAGRTYRYFKGKPLYGFGYGLSYSTFKYDQLVLPMQVKKGTPITLSVSVTNTGKVSGEEVVQVYMTNPNTLVKSPIKALKGFERISLKPGERRIMKFTLSASELSFIDEQGIAQAIKGKLIISAGGSQPDELNVTSGNVLKKTISIL